MYLRHGVRIRLKILTNFRHGIRPQARARQRPNNNFQMKKMVLNIVGANDGCFVMLWSRGGEGGGSWVWLKMNKLIENSM